MAHPVVTILFTHLWSQTTMASLKLTAIPGTRRIGPTDTVAGDDRARIACARNEIGSVQVVVTAQGGSAAGVDADISALRTEDGAEIPAGDVNLFRQAWVPIRHSAPRATCPPGMVADPLIPFVNPYTGEKSIDPKWRNDADPKVRFGATGFPLWDGHSQPLWLDVSVPADAAPGDYYGTVSVKAENAGAIEIPIEVTVWDFTLPNGPTHENHFGGFRSLARYHGIEPDSQDFETLEDRYIASMADHRINPPLPGRILPPIGDDGSIRVDEAATARFRDYVERYHLTNVEIPRAPFGDVLGADRQKAMRFYRSWYAFLDANGWTDDAYLYMLDEPNDLEAYDRVRALGALVQEAEPRIRRLVVEQTYTQNPDWGVLDGAQDIWCPLFAFIHEGDIERVQAQGDEVWGYTALVQPAPRYHPGYEDVKDDHPPYWQIDFPVTSYRIAPWLNRRYGITGLLYWATAFWSAPERNPWDDPGFRFRYNGDGFLFYPGEDAGIEGPVTSLRLKNLRDGMQDYEYFALLEELGGIDIVEKIVRQAVPTWGSWKQSPEILPDLKRRLAEEILRRG